MSDIEKEALALVNEMAIEECEEVNLAPHKTLCAALRLSVLEHEDTKQELHDYKQKVSDTLREYIECFSTPAWHRLYEFILPKPKPDPLEDVMEKLGWYNAPTDAENFRAALDKLGFEIREKNDG